MALDPSLSVHTVVGLGGVTIGGQSTWVLFTRFVQYLFTTEMILVVFCEEFVIYAFHHSKQINKFIQDKCYLF